MYLKVPAEMAEFALRESRTSEVMVYLATQFYFSGKAKTEPNPVKYLSNYLPLKKRAIYKHFNWLQQRNWIGKNESLGWYHFRGFNAVHNIEAWTFSRAVKMKSSDLQHIKPFLMAAFIISLVKTWKRGKETERKERRSEQLFYPVSHSALSKLLNISISTVKRYLKAAESLGYIKIEENLIKVTNMTKLDKRLINKTGLTSINVELLGYSDERIVPIDRIRFKDGSLYIQDPNIIYPLLELKSRRGLSKYR